MKTRSKITAAILSVMMLVGALPFAGCTPNQPQGTIVEPPAPVYSVHSVTLQYNNANIAGTITADLSAKQLQFSANVQKDAQADGTVVYTSDNPDVATIDKDGKVTLVGEGETAICAKAGAKTHTVVLIVKDDFSKKESYTITVNGGTANVTEAIPGDYVTLEALIPEHKEFVRWNYSVRGVLTNGNMFRMPAENIVITANYTDKLYTLNVVGGAEVTAEGEELVGEESDDSTIVSYGIPYGTELNLSAPDMVGDKVFVGWDGGVINNRVGEMGDPEYTFEMPGETYTVWANYSTLKTKVLTASNPSRYWDTSKGSKKITNGAPADEAADPDLEGLSGYRLTFSAGETALTTYPENIPGSVLDTVAEGTNTMKAIFKNHGDYDVTLELYATFYQNIVTSGHVTVPAHSTVTKYFTAGLGVYNPYMGIALREDIEGSSGTFNVDMVLGAAPMYPEGDPLLRTTGKAQLVQFDTSTDTKYGWAKEFHYNEKYGLATYSIYGRYFNDNGIPAARSIQISNMPAYDAENPYTIVYARIINNVTSGDYLSKFDVCVGTDADPRSGSNTYYETVVYEKVGDIVLIAIKVPRTENDGPFYFSVRKTTIEGSDTYYPHNFSIVLAYNNVFGYEGEIA